MAASTESEPLRRQDAPEPERGTPAEYGPSRPEAEQSYAAFHTPVYLRGYSRKILHDLIKVARLYAGRKLRLFRPGEGSRCSRCTNSLTGEVLDSRCPECHGTGRVGSWTPLGDSGASSTSVPPGGWARNPATRTIPAV